jgi:hypothetical protein
MPVAVVARQPGSFSGEDRSGTPGPHRRQQGAKAGALVAARATAAHVRIDHADLGTPPPAGLIREGLGPTRALGVGADLRAGGLADRDIGVTLAMGRVNLGAHAYTPRSGHCGGRG